MEIYIMPNGGIKIDTEPAEYSEEEMPGNQVNVLGEWTAHNTQPYTFASADDKSDTALHFCMIPLQWEADELGRKPQDLNVGTIAVVEQVYCNRAPLSVNSFEVNSYDKVAAVVVNNPNNRAIEVEPGDICIRALFIEANKPAYVKPIGPIGPVECV